MKQTGKDVSIGSIFFSRDLLRVISENFEKFETWFHMKDENLDKLPQLKLGISFSTGDTQSSLDSISSIAQVLNVKVISAKNVFTRKGQIPSTYAIVNLVTDIVSKIEK